MNKSSHETKGRYPFVFTLLYGAIVVMGAQLKVSMFAEGFVFSAGIILFALLLLILDEFATLPVVFISALGVMITRSFTSAGHIVGPDEIWKSGMADFVFYAVYGILIYLLFQYWKSEKGYLLTFVLLMIPDFAADTIELAVRQGGGITAKILLVMAFVAVIRSLIIIVVYMLIIRYGLPVANLPRGGVDIVDGKATKISASVEGDDTMMSWAAHDAETLYHKLQSANAPADIIEKAKQLAIDIESSSSSK